MTASKKIAVGGLVDADEVGGGGGVGVADPVLDGEGVGACVVDGIDAHPEAGGALELGDFGAAIAVEESGLQVAGVVLFGEGSGLNAPAAGRVGGGMGEGFYADAPKTGAVEADGLGGADGEIENAAFGEGATIGDADIGLLAGGEIRDADGGAQGKGAVGGGQAVLVVDGAVGGIAVVVVGAVPAGDSGLGVDGRAAGVVVGGAGGARRGVTVAG